jgi:hypothetical protein
MRYRLFTLHIMIDKGVDINQKEKEQMIYKGGCHCGAVTFEVEAAETIECQDCNCSICSKSGYLHLNVAKSKFKLLQGENNGSLSFGVGK